MPRRVRDDERRLRVHDDILRRHAARPEHRHLALADGHRIAVVRMREVMNADRLRAADLNRHAVYTRHLRGDGDGGGHQRVRNRPHAHHHVAREHARGRAGDAGVVHGDVYALFDLTHGHARLQQRRLKREAASDEEAHQLAARLVEESGDVGIFAGEHAVLVDAVFRDVARDVAARAELREGAAARVGDLQQRAGLRVALAEQQEVPGQLLGQHDEVALRVARAHASRREVDFALANQRAHGGGGHAGVISHGRSAP